MTETLFNFHVIRPALTPDPRYPPLRLAQTSDFQTALGRATQTPGDPRSGMDAAANLFIASVKFIQPNAADVNLTRLEKAAQAFDDILPAALDHTKTQAALTTAVGSPPATFLGEAWITPLEGNLKDSIVALRQIGVEEKVGHLDFLSRSLRTIDTIRKTVEDGSFPLSLDDLSAWRARPILAPTLFDLKSILSIAQEAEQDRQKALAAMRDSETTMKKLYSDRLDLKSTLDAIMGLDWSHRVVSPPTAPTPAPPATDAKFTPAAVANLHLSLINQYHNLATKQFQLNLGLTDRITSTLTPAAGAATDINPNLIRQPNLLSVGANPIDPSPAASLVEMSKTLFDQIHTIKMYNEAPPPAAASAGPIPFSLKPTALDALPPASKAVLKSSNIDITSQPIDATIRKLNSQLDINASSLDKIYQPTLSPVSKVSRIGGTTIFHRSSTIAPWALAFDSGATVPPPFVPTNPEPHFGGPKRHVNVLGLADLLIAKQQLIGYEKGDVAFIHNVLKGEKNDKSHMTTQSTSTTTTVEMETTTGTQTETSTADRFEVGSESNKTIQEAQALNAGMTVSGYGPGISVSANVSGSMNRSKSESTNTSTKYARDVTNKASQKIEKRILERTSTTTTVTNEDKVEQSFENKDGKKHISGVYQWVNKVYQAQNWYYGKRVMLDFMLPEPGAFLLDRASDLSSQKDEDVSFVPSFSASVRSITPSSYASHAADLGVTDIPQPPMLISRKAASYASGPSQEHFHAEVIAIPAGYEVAGISCQVTGTASSDFPTSWVGVICGQSFRFQWNPRSTDSLSFSDHGNHEQNEISFSATGQGMSQLSVNVEFLLHATQEAKDNWQSNAYIKLKTAHEKLVEAQKDSMRQAKFNNAVTPTGQNPEANLVTMRAELKKMCIETITDQHFDKFSAITPSITTSEEGLTISEINIDDAWKLGPVVRFFEQAFEWEHMTWLTYPYFWGRKSKWFQKVAYEDDDPVFQDFMRAGFARANLPVRPGFECAVDHFLSTGQVWSGGPLPGVTSETFLPIASEIQERLGKDTGDTVPYGEPWTVKVPTNLVKLRMDDDLPFWTQKAGEWVPNEDKAPVTT